MTDHATRPGEADSAESQPSADVRVAPADPEGVAATDAYEVDGGVVLFDTENPLAWVESDDALSLGRMV
ncbi:hypothetical protein C475_10709 [Halosimplex carlsbadense 2-9-1]|uniref:Uncharacterized protein n=1 Tax=Halosimplex carlsbadense 2-9-1 TaxID=797114 RepID=M0CQK5_9EURY|nr:hypothetical protein [Halosimplex carlsbadense]ELZ25496.1 hypothetical protein C475_10709 [Halosimplex carlsbadense 2-9-1]